MLSLILSAFIAISPNPLLGPHSDWEPLKDEYARCAAVALPKGHFNYYACAMGAQDRALHPTYSA